MLKLLPLRALLLVSLLLAGCSSGGGSGDSVVISNPGGGSGGSPSGGTVTPASATIALRVPQGTPGASPLAFEGPSRWNPLRWVSSPALAQAFYTLPGARVDAIGGGFAIADDQGVARFFALAPRAYRFVVTTDNPSVVFQTLLTAASGEQLNERLDQLTTLGALLAGSAADALSTAPDGADLEILAQQFEASTITEYGALRALVEEKIASSQAWFDLQDFLPVDPDVIAAVEAANQAATYRVLQVPFEGQVNYPTAPLHLSVTFNAAVDPRTLPGQGAEGWSLSGPNDLVLNASNLAANGGTVGYTGSQQFGLDGRVLPPNTLYFRFTGGAVAAGTPQSYRLSLPRLPRDAQGREVLSSTPASAFVNWSFQAFGTGVPGGMVGSGVTGELDFQASACQGSTNADLSDIPPPSFLQASLLPNEFRYQYQQVAQPFQMPSTERVFDLRINSTDSIQAGDVFQASASDDSPVLLIYEERDYSSNGTGGTNILQRRFRASEGSVTIISIQGNTVTATADVIFSAIQDDVGDQFAQGSFCAVADFSVTFP